jgi:hypothetical protein
LSTAVIVRSETFPQGKLFAALRVLMAAILPRWSFVLS